MFLQEAAYLNESSHIHFVMKSNYFDFNESPLAAKKSGRFIRKMDLTYIKKTIKIKSQNRLLKRTPIYFNELTKRTAPITLCRKNESNSSSKTCAKLKYTNS